MQREITDEYNQAQEFQRNVANVDYTTMVVNDILTRMCVIEHNGYHTAVVSYGKVIFIMSISFRYDDAAPLIYNITRYVGENSFEQWIGEVVLDATLPNSRRFGTMFAMRTNKDKNDITKEIVDSFKSNWKLYLGIFFGLAILIVGGIFILKKYREKKGWKL